MKKLFLVLALAAALVILPVILTTQKNTATDLGYVISIEDQQVEKGDTFKITVSVRSEITMDKLDAYITYDDSVLEFVGSESESVVGASGTLRIEEQFVSSCEEASYVITMKALAVGNTSLDIHDIYAEEENNADIIELPAASAQIQIIENEAVDTSAYLEELLVFPGTLDQEFDREVFDYSMTVDSDVEELILTAQPVDEDSIVTIEQPDVLRSGTNEVKIIVTALSGTEAVYTIHVTK